MVDAREMQRLQQENDFLKENLHRTQLELKAFQVKTNQQPMFDAGQAGDDCHTDDLAPWFANPEMMSPLLVAYDARINDLESVVRSQEAQLRTFHEQAEQLIAENEQLRSSQLKDLDVLIAKAEDSERGPGGQDKIDPSGELYERIDILMAENTVLVEQSVSMDQELEAIRDQLRERDRQVLTLSQNFTEAGAAVQHLQEQCDLLQHEKVRCERQLQQQGATMTASNADFAKAQDELKVSQSDVASLQTKNADYKKALRELDQRFEDEKDALMSRFQASSARIQELQGMLEEKTHQAEEAIDRCHKFDRDLTNTRADCEGMLQVMDGMEKQLGRYAAKQQEVEHASRESRDKIQQALLLRDQAQAKEVQSRREIARLLDRRRTEAEEGLKQQEVAIGAVRTRFAAQIASKDREIKELAGQNAQMQAECERCQRDKVSAQQEYQQAIGAIESERAHFKTHFDELQRRLFEAESRLGTQEGVQNSVQDELRASQDAWESKQRDWQREKSELDKELQDQLAQLASLREQLQAKCANLEESSRRQALLRKDMDELRAEASQRQSELLRTSDREMESTKAQLREREFELADAKFRLQESEEVNERMRDKYKRDGDNTQTEHDDQLSAARTRSDRLENQCLQLRSQLSAGEARCADLDAASSEQQQRASSLETSLKESERRVCDLTSRMSALVSKQQAQVADQARAKAEAERAAVEVARLRRELQQLQERLAAKKKR